MECAREQPRVTAIQPLPTDGDRRAEPATDVLKYQQLLERAADWQINQIRTCIVTVEAMRSNLSRMASELILLETSVVEQPNQEIAVGVSRSTTEASEE